MSISRYYEGRVIRVEKINEKGESLGELPLQSLWEHHELFQDAVNYYILALAAMTRGVKDDSPEKKSLLAWRDKVRETWTIVNRKGKKYNGPQKRIAEILGLKPEMADFETAAEKILQPSHATPEQRAAALVELYEEKGDLNQQCVQRLPWLATPKEIMLDATDKGQTSSQEIKRQQLVQEYHKYSEEQALEKAPTLDVFLFVTRPPKQGDFVKDPVKYLTGYMNSAANEFPVLASLRTAFEQYIKKQAQTLKIASLGRRPTKQYRIALLFKYFPCTETYQAFLHATKALANAKEKQYKNDAVAAARVDGHPHFEYFTNLVFKSALKDKHKTRAVWFEYDLAAFIEAMKSAQRHYKDTEVRRKIAEDIREKITAMENKGLQRISEEEEALPGFQDDERITLLKQIVQDKLAWLAEAEAEEEGNAPREYTIRERTVRGFKNIQRRWREAVEKANDGYEELLRILHQEQAKHLDDFGSAELYSELAKPENHPIWRDRGKQVWHAEHPIDAWLEYQTLRTELRDTERVIAFTPAHSSQSPRFFVFPKVEKKQQGKTGKLNKRSKHDVGSSSFTAGITVREGQSYTVVLVRVHYSAPRLYRDRLRSSGEKSLQEVLWLQPMIQALDIAEATPAVNFANCRITLQPANETKVYVGFPIEVAVENAQSIVGKGKQWYKQFNQHPRCNQKFYDATLRWPHEVQQKGTCWWEQKKSFSCLAVDLGQRIAGAFARLKVECQTQSYARPRRYIGEINGQKWHAHIEQTGLFRLPGEDAIVWREDNSVGDGSVKAHKGQFGFYQECSGKRGRLARSWEGDETQSLMRKLEETECAEDGELENTLLPPHWRETMSFPEQNDKLLIAMRRYQSRISRLHRWCWFLKSDEKKQQSAREEITQCKDTRLITPEIRQLAHSGDPRLFACLQQQLRQRLLDAPGMLISIANRILPLRGRSWQWEHHPESSPENPLHCLTQNGPSVESAHRPLWLRGQRGLSFARLEQIEELRRRCQSLNQTQRRLVGARPVTRRDESVPDPCPDLLVKIDHLKEERINQVAHMILAQALGLHLLEPTDDKKTHRCERDQHGAYAKTKDKKGSWIGTVDFVVIEDLSRYRAWQGRAPRENSRLMKWCHRAIRNKLVELCEVFGIRVVETPAAYSSRFCSRSGVPGFRAEEVTAGFSQRGHWAWKASRRDDTGTLSAEAQRLREVEQMFSKAQSQPPDNKSHELTSKARREVTLLVPSSGGQLFVPIVADAANSELAPVIMQADINAAINIGLRAVADPREWSIHPRLRTQRQTQKSAKKETKESRLQTQADQTADHTLYTREKRKFGETNLAVKILQSKGAKQDENRTPNFFADFANLSTLVQQDLAHSALLKDWTCAELTDYSLDHALVHDKSFWGAVNELQWERCREINRQRLEHWGVQVEDDNSIF